MKKIIGKAVLSYDELLTFIAEIKSVMNINISFDHRVINGIQGAKFMCDLKLTMKLFVWKERNCISLS